MANLWVPRLVGPTLEGVPRRQPPAGHSWARQHGRPPRPTPWGKGVVVTVRVQLPGQRGVRLAGAGPVGDPEGQKSPALAQSWGHLGSPKGGQHMPYVANRTQLLWVEGKLTFVDLLCARARYFDPFF